MSAAHELARPPPSERPPEHARPRRMAHSAAQYIERKRQIMHTISPEARPVQPRDSRKGAQPAYTAQGERIVKRHSTPAALPIGTTVIEKYGARLRREDDGMWHLYRDSSGNPVGKIKGEGTDTLDLAYPVVEIRPKQRGHHLARAERRRDERAAVKAERKLARFKSKRVEQYLAAVKAAEGEQ